MYVYIITGTVRHSKNIILEKVQSRRYFPKFMSMYNRRHLKVLNKLKIICINYLNELIKYKK